MSDYSPLKGSTLYGKIVVIRRSGEDGSIFPMTLESCVIGRSDDCSIRVVLPTVSDKQCQIQVLDDETVEVMNLSSTSPTRLNSRPLTGSAVLNHKDLISIVDRHFRFEYPDGHPMSADEASIPKRRSSVGKSRKSKSPGKAASTEEMLDNSKVLTPGRKPPLPVYCDDVENKSPELVAGSSIRRQRRSSIKRDMTPSKILTPKIKPPVPSAVARVMSVGGTTPGSPAPPGRKSAANLRKSLTEIRQRSDSIAETPDIPDEPVLTRKSVGSGRKRKSESPAQSQPMSKRKRVSFGVNLSPELFDKRLPPGTPVRKGSAPRRVSVGVIENVPSPRAAGLLKRRSVASVPQSKTIKEESPLGRRSKSPAGKVSKKSSPVVPKVSPEKKKSSAKKARHVVVKSPHVPHHVMSEEETRLYSEQRKDEGAAFKRLSHSPESNTGSPIPLSFESTSASPQLAKGRTAGKNSPLVISPARLTPMTRTPVNKTNSPHLTSSKASPRVTPSKASPRATPSKASPRATPSKASPRVTPGKASPRVTPGKASPRATPSKASPRATPSKASPRARASPLTTPSHVSPRSASKPSTPTQRQARNVMTPGLVHVVHTDTPRPKTPASSKKEKVEKIETPPIDFHKAVALRAIHGKAATPKLPASAKKQSSVVTPATARKQPTPRSSAKKVPVRKTWADIVKTGKRNSVGGAKRKSINAGKKAAVKRPAAVKKALSSKSRSIPQAAKTPRAAIRGAVQSTGHVDSPETFVLRKSRTAKTERQVTPEAADAEYDAAYDDMPPTPAPPTIMFVSPMPGEKRRARKSPTASKRKSVSLVGVKEMFNKKTRVRNAVQSPKLGGIRTMMKSPKQQASPRLDGVREMFRSPKEVVSPRYTGIREMVKTPKPVQSPRLAGVREMMKTPKEAASPQLKGVRELMKTPKQRRSADLTGVADLFAENDSPVPVSEKPASSQKAAKSPTKSASPVKATRGRRAAAVVKKATPAKRATRGKKPVPVAEAETIEQPMESPKKRGGRKKVVESESVVVSAPVKRGRGKAAAKPATTISPEKGATPAKPTRGRGKKAVEAPVVADKSPSPVKVRGRGRKAVVVADVKPAELEETKPVRGRRAAAAKTADSPAPKSRKKAVEIKDADTPKTDGRKRKAAAYKSPEKAAAEPTESPPKKRRGRPAAATPAEKEEPKANKARGGRVAQLKAEADAPTTPVQKKRGRKPATPAKVKSPVKEATPKPRGRRAATKPVPTKSETSPNKPATKRGRPAKVKDSLKKTPVKRTRKAATKASEKSPTPVRKTRSRK